MAIRVKNPHTVFNLLLVLGGVVFSLVPDLYMTSLYVQIALMILWYIDSAFFMPNRALFKGNSIIVILILFFLVQLAYQIMGISDIAYGNYFMIWSFNDIVIKAIYIKQVYEKEQKKFLFRIIQLFLLLLVLILISRERYDIDASFYNMLAFVSGITFCYISKEKSVIYKILDIVLLFSSITFMLVFTPRLIALLILISIVVVSIIASVKKVSLRILLVALLVVMGLLSMSTVLKELVVFLPERIQVRVNALLYADNTNNEYLGRIDLIIGTLRTYFSSVKNFMLGVGYHFGYNYWSGPRMIGQHSLITDYLAAYGIFGAMFVYSFFKRLWAIVSYNTAHITIVKAMYISFVLISIVTRSFVSPIAIGAILLTCLVETKKVTEEV